MDKIMRFLAFVAITFQSFPAAIYKYASLTRRHCRAFHLDTPAPAGALAAKK